MLDTEEEKIMALFTTLHELPNDYHTEIGYNADNTVECVKVMCGYNLCWQVTKVDLLLDFVTTKLQCDYVTMHPR